jgi:hypothetical protein
MAPVATSQPQGAILHPNFGAGPGAHGPSEITTFNCQRRLSANTAEHAGDSFLLKS